MDVKNSHGGYEGKSLIEKIEIDLYAAYDEFKKNELLSCVDCGQSREEAFAEGIAHALGILRGSSCDYEWEQIEEKWKEVNL